MEKMHQFLYARKSRVKAATTIISNQLQSAEGVLQGQTIVEVVTQPKCLTTSRELDVILA